VVICVLLCSPALSKGEKAATCERVQKLFEQGAAAGLYSARLAEAFKGFDVADTSARERERKESKSKTSFWGRRK
jgi:hypothetical protein